MIGYKLFRVRRDGTLGSLFINRRRVLRPGRRYAAECYPTSGFAVRQGWHILAKPEAPHLSMAGRRWYEVEFPAKGAKSLRRPERQGGLWYIATHITIMEPV
jgi:hypothetical protein